MNRSYSKQCPEFLRNESDYPAVGRMVSDREGTEMVWREAKRLGVRVYEVKGWMGHRSPATYLVVNPEDLSRIPVHPSFKTWILGLPIARIPKKCLRATREVVRMYDPTSNVKNQHVGYLSMHFAQERAVA